MLVIALPKGQDRGKCKVNGGPCDFRIQGQTLLFRHDGETTWDKRAILATAAMGGQMGYTCESDTGDRVTLPDED